MIDVDEIVRQVSSTNQKTVDLLALLAKSNSLLIEYVLVKEVEGNGHSRESAGHIGYKLLQMSPGTNEAPATNGALQLPSAPYNTHPAVEVKKRGRPPLNRTDSAASFQSPLKRTSRHKGHASGYHVEPGTKVAWVTDFALANNGIFDLGLFKEDFRRRKRKPDSFIKTTVNAVCSALVGDGIFRRLDMRRWKLEDPSRVPPLPLTPAASAAASAAPPLRSKSLKTAPVKAAAVKAAPVGSRPFVTHRQRIIDFAKSHDWIFKVIEARTAWKDDPAVPQTYTRTTVFTDLRTLQMEGVMKQIGPGQYELVTKD